MSSGAILTVPEVANKTSEEIWNMMLSDILKNQLKIICFSGRFLLNAECFISSLGVFAAFIIKPFFNQLITCFSSSVVFRFCFNVIL